MQQPPQSLEKLHELASRPTPGVLDALRGVDSDVLVIGAGGKMGYHLSAMLHRGLRQNGSPHRVVAVSRFAKPGSTRLFHQAGIATQAVDLNANGAVDPLPASSFIYYLAGVKFGTSGNPALLQQTNVVLSRMIAERFQTSQIVALSTGCVYPFVPVAGQGSKESDPTRPIGEYAESCLGRELSFTASKARTCLIRLNYSVDLRYGVLVDIAQRVIRRQPVDVSTGYVNVIWQGDAIAYIIQALQLVASPPSILNVTGARKLSVRDIADRFGSNFGVPVSVVGNPAPTAWLSDAAQCHRLFGPPSVDELQLIDWVADWVRAKRPTLDKPTHFETRDGNY